jgi:threonine/homoserine/homoserine lactone efflux protein
MILVMSRFIAQDPVEGMLSRWLRSRPHALLWLYRSSGAILLGLGIRLALERRE